MRVEERNKTIMEINNKIKRGKRKRRKEREYNRTKGGKEQRREKRKTLPLSDHI